MILSNLISLVVVLAILGLCVWLIPPSTYIRFSAARLMVRYSLGFSAMGGNQLRDLVHQYASGVIDYAGFRREFVQRFLSIRHQDAALNGQVNLIEGLCADFSEGLIPSESLRSRVADIVLPAQILHMTDMHFTVMISTPPPRSVQMVSGSRSEGSLYPAGSVASTQDASATPLFAAAAGF